MKMPGMTEGTPPGLTARYRENGASYPQTTSTYGRSNEDRACVAGRTGVDRDMALILDPCRGPMLPPTDLAGPDAGGPILLTCDGVEVTQAIQDMAHSVPLIAQKRTVARVYLGVGGPDAVTVSGVMRVRRVGSGGLGTAIRAQAPLTIDPALNGNLRAKRESEARSLNFILPRQVLTAGQWEVRLSSVARVQPHRALLVPAGATRTVTFTASPPLRVRIVGIRFQSGPATVTPTPLDFTLIQSWLGRAYPVASVEWSQITLDGPSAWPFQAPAINAFLRGLRATDVAGGVDARTHYYGLVADNDATNFMRGLASGIPTTADPSTVASGPCGASTFGWDTDGSYGDWYTGHELGHTFGRFHAEFCGAGGGAPYPFTGGQLSNADGAFVGFDVGDIANGLPLRALPGTAWHDVMSYCVNQWISSFTYTGIRTRLVAEDSLLGPAGPAGAGAALPARRARTGARRASSRGGAMAGGTIHVVATLNVTRQTGELRHVTPVTTLPPGQTPLASGRPRRRATTGAATAPTILLRVFGRGAAAVTEYVAPFIPDACRDAGDDATGSIDAFLPSASSATRLELVLGGVVVDTFTPAAAAPPAVADIRGSAPPRLRRGGAVRSGIRGRAAEPTDPDTDPVISWTSGTAPAGRGARAASRGRGGTTPAVAAPGRGGDTRYTVQLSVDGGSTWQTVGYALTEPQVRIDRGVLGDADTVKVRVTATTGFKSVSTEKTMKASELG
jgi:hypothetical protein